MSFTQTEKANKRIKVLEHQLAKLSTAAKNDSDSDDDDDDDDDLDESEGLKAEMAELQKQNKARQDKLHEYEKYKKWNVDNMFHVKEERTVINPAAAKQTYTTTGFIQPSEDDLKDTQAAKKKQEMKSKAEASKPEAAVATAAVAPATAATAKKPPASADDTKKPAAATVPHFEKVDPGAFDTYPEFTEKYADTVEAFMAIPDLERSKEFLLQHAQILLQENASNYLLLASLEDEMNGHREKMKRTARQSQIVTHIAEMAKTLDTHPGNCIMPFFMRMQERQHLEEFVQACKDFQDKIIQRAIVKKKEIDEARAAEAGAKNLEDIPREERLGPGGLDPLEVIETLPQEMVEAFESRDVDQLRQVLEKLDPKDAEYHMKRCVDSGLWVANS